MHRIKLEKTKYIILLKKWGFTMINIKVNDLKKIIDELIEDKIKHVQISILEKEKFEDEIIPASINFSGFSTDGY